MQRRVRRRPRPRADGAGLVSRQWLRWVLAEPTNPRSVSARRVMCSAYNAGFQEHVHQSRSPDYIV